MEAYLVRVLTRITVGESGRRAVSTWVVSSDTAEEATRIIAGRVAAGREIQSVNEAPAGTAARYKLAKGQARLTYDKGSVMRRDPNSLA